MFDWLGRLLYLPIQRPPEQQRPLDEAARGLILYTLPWCGYCARVRRVIRRLNVPIEQRNTAKNPEWERELRRGGGKMQAPCLRIEHPDGVDWRYESDEIIRFLYQRFSPTGADTRSSR
ncbi:MAG: glutaredoxin [Candidatus Thiodiazotropha sp.]